NNIILTDLPKVWDFFNLKQVRRFLSCIPGYIRYWKGRIFLKIKLKRIYDESAKVDGVRILVDRLWPRGVSKEKAKLDHWLKEIGPTDELRKSFHHDEMSFKQFKEKYLKELKSGEQKEALDELKK